MENKSMRFLSLLLALVMVISLMPVGHIHAEEGGLIKVPAAEAATELGLENIGDSAEFVIATGRKDRAVKTMIGNAVSGGGKSGVELINDTPDVITFEDAPAAFWTITKVEGGYTISVDGTNSVQINGNNNATLAEGAVVQIRVSENGSYGTGYFEIFNSIDGTNYFLNYFDSFGGVTASGCAASVWSDNDPGSQWKIYKVIEKAPEIDIWNKAAWTKVSVDTETAHNDTEGLFEYAFDGKLNTIWHSNWKDGANDVLTGENTFAGEINFGQEYFINQFSFLPRQDDTNWANGDGVVTMASLYVKDADDTEWKLVAEHQEFEHSQDLKTFTFEAQNVQYVRFVAERSVYNGWVAVAEFYINYEEPAAHEHSYKPVVTDPTCTEDGYTTYTCECGDSYVADVVDALGHSYEVDVTAPTCTEGGYTTYTCTVCGDSYVVDVPALGHTTGKVVVENDVPATCTEDGSFDAVYYCTVCGAEESRETTIVKATGHYEAVVSGYPATCEETGLTDGVQCCVCQEWITAQEKIPATGHTPATLPGYDATCTADGLTDGTYCTVCDATITAQEKIPALGHNYEDGNCTRCGEADPDFVAVIATGWSGYTEWALTADGVLTFTSSGQTLNGETNLKNYWKVGGVLTLPWGQYADMITKVVIEDGIHDIGQMAFYELPNLQIVELGKDVTEIRNYTFKNCKNLTSINLESVDFIREGAFYGCAALENITFAEGVVVEDWAFSRTPYVEMNP